MVHGYVISPLGEAGDTDGILMGFLFVFKHA